jgi:Carboxypeptidase regulatory-like domain
MNGCCFALLFLISSLLSGQSTTGTLQGVVIDSTGGGIPAATITLRQLSSSALRAFATGDAGQFQAAGLPIGTYSLRVQKSGFNPVNMDSLTISVGQTTTQRITMSPASVMERMEVQEQADTLQTSATTANVALGGERIEEAPAQNRNYLNFVLSAPAVSASPQRPTRYLPRRGGKGRRPPPSTYTMCNSNRRTFREQSLP